jgi:hypothetical protein
VITRDIFFGFSLWGLCYKKKLKRVLNEAKNCTHSDGIASIFLRYLTDSIMFFKMVPVSWRLDRGAGLKPGFCFC